MNKSNIVTLAVGIGLTFNAHAERTLEITTAQGAGADSYIRGTEIGHDNYHGENFGSGEYLEAKGSPNNSYNRVIYLRFDLSLLEGLTVKEATLQMSASKAVKKGPSGRLYGLIPGYQGGPDSDNEAGITSADELGELWAEDALTWDNAPGQGDSGNRERLANRKTYHINKFSVRNLDIGDLETISGPKLTWFLNQAKGGTATLIVEFKGDRSATFASKENSNFSPPTLLLVVE